LIYNIFNVVQSELTTIIARFPQEMMQFEIMEILKSKPKDTDYEWWTETNVWRWIRSQDRKPGFRIKTSFNDSDKKMSKIQR
jgi:hypothetical protein